MSPTRRTENEPSLGPDRSSSAPDRSSPSFDRRSCDPDRPSGDGDGCRCTISYSIDRVDGDDHESWLLEWTVDLIDCPAIDNVEIGRTTLDDQELYEIVLDLGVDCVAFRRQHSGGILDRLDRRVGGSQVDYWLADGRDRGYC